MQVTVTVATFYIPHSSLYHVQSPHTRERGCWRTAGYRTRVMHVAAGLKFTAQPQRGACLRSEDFSLLAVRRVY